MRPPAPPRTLEEKQYTRELAYRKLAYLMPGGPLITDLAHSTVAADGLKPRYGC